ncbi:unnamed protein product [Auanema sp. JU1783]|nr:unnamed protein product [Auanema sp. JU1783]
MYDENSNTAPAGSVASVPSAALASGQLSGNVAAPSTALVSQLLNVKDSRWLQVEVCREFQRGQCARSDQECKFAHPPPHVDVQQGRVTACYDSIKGRCTRENPKCKYLHPPQHIKDQLLINGRNNLALKNLISAQLNQGTGATPLVNPLQSLQQIQLHQQQQANLAAANLIPTLHYPYYQGMIYPAMLQDPYQAAVTQQLQAAALLQSAGSGATAGGHVGHGGLLAAQAAQLTVLQPNLTNTAPALSLPPSVVQPTPTPSQAAKLNRKRTLEDDDIASNTQQAHLLNLAAAVSAAAGVPCKRPALDKNGTVVYQGQPTQQFNPYLLQGLQGYVPAVSFSGQLPPRY